MMKNCDFDELIVPLQDLLKGFLKREWKYEEFRPKFQSALRIYEQSIQDRAYGPLGLIANCPIHAEPQLDEYCKLALSRLPKEALDRSTRVWIESTLVGADGSCTYFTFRDKHGKSRYEVETTLYSTELDICDTLKEILESKAVLLILFYYQSQRCGC